MIERFGPDAAKAQAEIGRLLEQLARRRPQWPQAEPARDDGPADDLML